jgi:hypothetical protein
MTARYPLVRVGADISELPAGDTLIGVSSYTLPVATTTVLGGVKVDGTTITITSDGIITSVGGGGGGTYTLPPATTTTLGGVIPDGISISVDSNGVITTTSTSKIKQLVKNSTAATLTKGQAVYISGATGANVEVALARANAESTSSKTLGLIEADIAVGATGYVITEGALIDFNTSSAGNEGDAVWLSPTTAGELVYGLANKPVAPNHMVYLGVVSRKNINNGVIFIKVQNGFELDELHNVLAPTSGLANNDILTWEASSSLWKNKQLAGTQVTTALGFTPYDSTNPSGYTSNLGTVTSVSGTGTVSGLTLSGSVTSSGSLTLEGTLAVDYSSLTGTVPTWNQNTTGNAAGLSATLAIASGGTGATTLAGANLPVTNVTNTFTGTQTFTGTSTTLAAILTNAAETTTVSATAATGTIAYYTASQSVLYYTSNATANWTLNITHSEGTTLNTAMSVGQTITVTHMVPQGATAFYNNVVQIDGTTTGVTTKWQNGVSPTSGNTQAIDVYTYAIIKTGAATFTILAAIAKFA